MKKLIIIILLLPVVISTALSQPMTDIRILNENQHSIVLEFTPKFKTEHITGSNGTVFTKFQFFGSQIKYDQEGRSDFIRPLLLLLPSAKYSLQVLSSEYQTRDTIKLVPKPVIKPLKDLGVTEIYDETNYSRLQIPIKQNVLADLINVGKSSIGYVGTLVLHPVQLIDKEKVRTYTRIVVRIDFTDAFPAGLAASCLMKGNLPQKSQIAKMSKAGARQAINADSPLAQGDWYRMEVTETGMYKLSYSFFSNLNVPSFSNINSIRLYGNGGVPIPDDNISPRPNTLQEIPRLVVDQNKNGVFDQDDYVIFFGRGVRGWNYNSDGSYSHYLNPYSDKNYYFFTFSQTNGRQMDTVSVYASSPSAIKPTAFQEKILTEDEKYNLQNSGRLWVGEVFSGSDEGEYDKSLPGLNAGSQVNYKFKFYHRSTSNDMLEILEHGQSIRSTAMNPAGSGDAFAAVLNTNAWSSATLTADGTSKITIKVTANQDSKTWLDWMEIYYERKFEAVNDALLFSSLDATGLFEYDITNFSGDVMAFDVTDHDSVKQLKFFSADPSICKMQLQQTQGSVTDIAVVGGNGYKTPSVITKIDNTNLHNTQSQYDNIIISPTEFLSAANQLKAFRETHDGLRTLVVNINQIYNEFSSGIPDPLAIREFIRYTQTDGNWLSMPQYVLLLGWGHFDYRNISTTVKNYIPPFETDESLDIVNTSYPTDDKLALLDPNNSVYSVALGRIPARNASEAATAVNKIISYETSALNDSSSWRNILTFVADDGLTSTSVDDRSQFTDPTEALAESDLLKSFEKKKIYIVDFPTVNSASGRRKPGANIAIDDAINEGTLITNFIGHGNETLWAHEHIFNQDDDFPKLNNRDRPTFVFAATCSYSKFDGPDILSSGEQLVTMENGGAIGTFGASRAVFNPPNVYLNDAFFSYLFNRDSTGKYPRLGDAVKFAKSMGISGDPSNTMKFYLFGDPALHLLIPDKSISMDSVNGKSTSSMITMKSLAHVPILGSMKNSDGSSMSSFQGKGILQVFDSPKEVHILEGLGDFRFKTTGSLLYRGGVTFQNGSFKATIPIPKDVTFGNSSRISMYAQNGSSDGSGYTENVKISGIDTTSSTNKDVSGPQMSIYLNDLDFRSGDVVKKDPTLIVKFHDESGINTSTAGVGHQLSATLDNPDRTINLSNYYQSDYDTYKSGEVRYLLSDLTEGKYTLRVKAWDILNNSSEAEIYFTVALAEDLTLINVVNYPNPFSKSTTFTFQRIGTEPINVEVKIFSIAGRLIGRLNMDNITDRSVRIPWDGRDNDGDALANGVYLYKLIVRSLDGQHTSESIGKMAIVR